MAVPYWTGEWSRGHLRLRLKSSCGEIKMLNHWGLVSKGAFVCGGCWWNVACLLLKWVKSEASKLIYSEFIDRYKSSFLTKVFVLDFRKNPPDVSPVTINNQSAEAVNQHKYPGSIKDNKVTWNQHVDAVRKKSNERIHFYRKHFNIDSTFIGTFQARLNCSALSTRTSWWAKLQCERSQTRTKMSLRN